MLIQTATDLQHRIPDPRDPDNPDTASPVLYYRGPDFATGYGLVNAEAAARLIEDARQAPLVHENSLLQGTQSYEFTVDAPLPEVKVTLAWDDREGSAVLDQRVPRLVNDLDLVLVDPAGNRHYPWTLDPLPLADCGGAGPGCGERDPVAPEDVRPAYRGPDHRNNVEQVQVENPRPGRWKVLVAGHDLQDVSDGPQAYSLASSVPLHLVTTTDLVAASLSWSPQSVNEDDAVSISFAIRNAGVAAAGSFHVQVTRDGFPMCDWAVPGLGAGEVYERTCSGKWGIPSARPPGHTIVLKVDDQGAVAESDESNNRLSVFVPVRAAFVDLLPTSVKWAPDPAKEGDAVGVTFQIRNRGNVAAGRFHVLLVRDGSFMCDWVVAGLDPGDVYQRTCSGWYGIPSATRPGHAVLVRVDDRNEVAETDESNNTLGVFIPVTAP